MKRVVAMILAVVMVIGLCACKKEKKRPESPVEDFEYEMVDGEVVITGYRGVDREIYIPEMINERPVTQIGEEAFAEYDLTLIDFPDTVVKIGEAAFENCTCLSEVRLSKNIMIIDEWAFFGCTTLTNIYLPEGLLEIGLGAFERCIALKEVTLPDSLEFLGNFSFEECESMSELKIPDNFTGFEIEVYLKGRARTPIGDVGISVPYEGNPVMVVSEGSLALQKLQSYPEIKGLGLYVIR